MPPQARTPEPPPARHAERILYFMDDLTRTLEDEITLLEKHEYARHNAILKRKQELTLQYQTTLKAFNDSPDKTAAITPQERASLQTRGKILEAVTLRNAKALRIAQASSERLLQHMMNEVRKQLHKESSYSKTAVLTVRQKEVVRPVAYSQQV